MGREPRSNFKMDRLDILDNDIANEINSYRNWGQFPLMIDPFPDGKGGYIGESGTGDDKKITVPAKGTKSLFSPVHAVYYSDTLRRRNNMPLIDTQDNRSVIRKESDCSVKALVENSNNNRMGRAVYNYTDFMYCTELGRVSNNYLVTLRRFAAPCGDNILYVDPDNKSETDFEEGLQSHGPDIGRMVTWIGVSGNEMSNILKYDFNMSFRELNAEIQRYDGPGDANTTGALGALLNATTKSYQEYAVKGYGGDRAFNYLGTVLGGDKTTMGRFMSGNSAMGNVSAQYSNADWRGFRDNNKVYGNVDTIKKTTVRGYDGLQFNQSITLNFDYEMRSYDGINTKAAFLDLLSNILAVTYSTGTFWGGGYRMTSGSPQSNVFANLPIFKYAESGEMTFGGLIDAAFGSLKDIWGQISQGEGLMGAIKTLGSGVLSMFTGAALNAIGRPTKIALNSIIEPVPTGMWHLTIGNPMHPIMVMGNMILEKTEIEHYGPLGLDDFPTGLRVTCTLKHGKPRDTSMIENMYVLGHSRVYIPVGDYVLDMYDNASEYMESRNSESSSSRRTNSSGSNMDGSSIASTIDNVLGSAGSYVQNGYIRTVDKIGDRAYDYLVKYFGTKNTTLIINAAKEVAYGSKPIDNKNKSSRSPNKGKGNRRGL